MNVLDRYILKKFIVTFLAIIIMLPLIIALVDFANKNDTFIRHGFSRAQILDYYRVFLPFLVNFLTPFIVFITVIFITSRLAQRAEVIAILSSGVSYARFMRPFLGGAILISLFSFVLMGWVLASANKKRIDYDDQIGISVFFTPAKYLHIRVSPTEYLYIEKYRSVANTGTNATIETILEDKMIEKLYAKSVDWIEDRGIWVFRDWTLRVVGGMKEQISQGSFLEKKLNIDPKDLAMNPRLYETQTLPELHRHIRELKTKQADSIRYFITEMNIRYMVPFASIILTIMGIAVASYKSRRGAGMQISFGIALAFVYIAMFLFTRGYAEVKGSNIPLTIWAPNLIFSFISYVMYRVVPK